ncbi:hypothetical protein OPQ81_008903 [Rhizoctonia solani]|nr:hypothetical protein OPQ81_008903 [Rhizoctonia solani]
MIDPQPSTSSNIPSGYAVNRIKFETIGSGNTITEIIIHADTLSKDWSRYWFYARYVKHLDAVRCELIAPGPRITCHIQGWNTLFQKLKESVLLPNLRTLNFSLMRYTSIEAIHLLYWFTLFLSPSLQTIAIVHSQRRVPEFPTSPALLLITSLAMALPNADKINLSSHYSFPTETTLASVCPSGYRERYNWFTHLPNLTGLRSLSIHDPGFSARSGEGLFVLGHLPYLVSLSIRCNYNPTKRHSCISSKSATLGSKPIPVELMIELVSRLPLQSLATRLKGTEAAEDTCFAYQELDFPTLRHLELADSINRTHLKIIAKIFPNLETLEFSFDDSGLGFSDDSGSELGNYTTQQLIKINATSRRFGRTGLAGNKTGNHSWHNVARTLGSLWPNASHIKIKYPE